MSSYGYIGEMKVPVRAAPPPPSNWSASLFSRDKTSSNKGGVPPKKKPPPRPPPPKINQSRSTDVRGALVNGLFPQRIQTNQQTFAPPTSLIDWNSPPSSPTPTTRSSSDALSVNSFGSDSVTPSSGNVSNESGFEDDFDLISATRSKVFDPWKPPPQPEQPTKWVSFSPSAPKKFSMPTIIRPKPERPKPPKVLEKKMEMDALSDVFRNVKVTEPVEDNIEYGWDSESPPMPTIPAPAPPPEVIAELLSQKPSAKTSNTKRQSAVALYDYSGAAGDLSFREGDTLYLLRRIDDHWYDAEFNGQKGTVPANFIQIRGAKTSDTKRQSAVALYDYSGAAGDLSFRAGDTLYLLRRIDDNWYEAEFNGQKGTVPSNFLETADPRLVNALYQFSPETQEDLALEPGLRVRLLGRIDDSWIYGEANGKRGQLPAAFVDSIPSDLPLWKS